MIYVENPDQFAEHAYLWESGEWSLQITHHSRQRVIFVFPAGRPSMTDLISVRALIPRFTIVPITDLKREIGEASEFVVGEMPNLEARRLLADAKIRGLHSRSEDTSFVSHLPVNEGGRLIIEDDELARRIGTEMKRRGVPVIYVEAD